MLSFSIRVFTIDTGGRVHPGAAKNRSILRAYGRHVRENFCCRFRNRAEGRKSVWLKCPCRLGLVALGPTAIQRQPDLQSFPSHPTRAKQRGSECHSLHGIADDEVSHIGLSCIAPEPRKLTVIPCFYALTVPRHGSGTQVRFKSVPFGR